MHCPVPINFFILDICLKWRSRTLFASNFYQAKCWKFRDLPVLSVCCLARYETNTWFLPRNKALLLLDLVFDPPGFQMSFFIPKAPLKYILWLWKIFFPSHFRSISYRTSRKGNFQKLSISKLLYSKIPSNKASRFFRWVYRRFIVWFLSQDIL